MNSQILKGILEGCILKLIEKEPMYGYDIITRLHEFNLDMVSEGSIYPLLLKLQKSGYIKGTRIKSKQGPMRKYYSLTEEGLSYLKIYKDNWDRIDSAVNTIFLEDTHYETDRKRV